MANYHIWTIGCQMNQADSARLAEGLEKLGYAPSPTPEPADLVVLNSCVVRQSAETRVTGRINSLKPLKRARPEMGIAVVGCLVDGDLAALRRRFPHVDLFLPPAEEASLLEWAARGAPSAPVFVPLSHLSVTAFVPVIEGCDNFCSYCIVPYRRGRERSRPVGEVACEVEGLAARGVREVTILGQNVDSYGHDLPGEPALADLLEAIHSIDGLWRIRFLTSHPKDMRDKLVNTVARLPKVCPNINLPVQAGHDEILKAMRRGYTVAEYRRRVERIRGAIPGVALSTDVIVGFPGETEAQFQATYDLLAELRFDTVHVAAYSPRPGTIAARTLSDDVPPEEKKRRLHAIEALQEGIAAEINAQLLGKTVEVLVEDKDSGKWRGRTPTGKLVFFTDGQDWRGQVVNITVERTSPWSLQGKPMPGETTP